MPELTRAALRRPVVLAIAPALALTLAACGSDDDVAGASGFDAVSISGEVGTSPKIDFSDRLAPGEEQEKVLVEGDGPALADGDRVLVQVTLANGFTREVTLDSYDATTPGFVGTVGESGGTPQIAGDLIADYVMDHVEAGTTVGTRIAITAGVDKAFPDYPSAMAGYDFGNQDGMVVVADLVGTVADKVDGATEPVPGWAPSVVTKKGLPVSLDFSGAAAPSGKVRVATLIEGTGPEVTDGSAVVTEYLGQIYQGDQPFDSSFTKKTDLTALIGAKVEPLVNTSIAGPVVKGWTEGLIGVKTGSRVLIEIPPALGYGKKGQGEDIPGGSTLYFVIDVLGVA